MSQITGRIVLGILFSSLSAIHVGAQVIHPPEILQLTQDKGIGHLYISSPRPLKEVVYLSSERYGVFIDFEDPPYDPEETRDDTDPHWRTSHPSDKGVTMVNGTSFDATFQEKFNEDGQLDDRSVLEPLVSKFNTSGNPGTFHLAQEGPNRYSVVGVPHDGSKPILDTLLTVPAMNDTFEAVLGTYLSEINGITGRSLSFGSANRPSRGARDPAGFERSSSSTSDSPITRFHWTLSSYNLPLRSGRPEVSRQLYDGCASLH